MRTRVRSMILAAVLTLTPMRATGEEVPLTLAEGVALAVRDNLDVRSAHEERVARRFDLVVAERQFTPRYTLEGAVERRRDGSQRLTSISLSPQASLTTPVGTAIRFRWSGLREEASNLGVSTGRRFDITVEQPLLRGAGRTVGTLPLAAARLADKEDRLRLRDTVSSVVTSVVVAYRTILQARARTGLVQAGLDRARQLVEVNRALIAAGRLPAAEIVQAETDVALQELAEIEARSAEDRARRRLLDLLAMDPDTRFRPTDDIDTAIQRVSVDVDAALAVAFSTRTDVVSGAMAVERARLGLVEAKDRQRWDLSAVGGASFGSRREPGFGDRDIGDDHIGLRLSIPLGDLALRQAELRATTSLRTAELRFEGLRRRVETEVREAVADVDTNWRQLELARRASDLARRSVELEREKLRVGRSSNFQVLSFEASLREAEAQLLDAKIGYLNSLTLLDQSLGTTLDTWQIALLE